MARQLILSSFQGRGSLGKSSDMSKVAKLVDKRAQIKLDAQGSLLTTLSTVGGNHGPSLCGSQHMSWSCGEEKSIEKFLHLGKTL